MRFTIIERFWFVLEEPWVEEDPVFVDYPTCDYLVFYEGCTDADLVDLFVPDRADEDSLPARIRHVP